MDAIHDWHKIESVQKMQDFIREHLEETPFPFMKMYKSVGYSQRHADRLFKELLHKTPQEYVKALLLSKSADNLLDKNRHILDVALDASFQSHEGYTKAFSKLFGVAPSTYKEGKTPIPLFLQYPVKGYYAHIWNKETNAMDKKTFVCMITPVSRPERKLVFLPSRKATDYWSYCEEMSCDWEGIFNSYPTKLDKAALLTLPPFLIKDGFSPIASGVELPAQYNGSIPENCGMVTLPPCEMLYFTVPFDKNDDFFDALGEAFHALEAHEASAAHFGYTYAYDLAPQFNYGGEAGRGARLAVPIRRLK